MIPISLPSPGRARFPVPPRFQLCALVLLCHIGAAQSALGQSLFQKRPYAAPPASTPTPQPASAEPPPAPSPSVVRPQSREAQSGPTDPATPSQSQPAPGADAGAAQPNAGNGSGTGTGVVMPTIQQEYKSGPMSVRSVSLMAVIPPEPRMHKKHDKIELIVNESSLSTSQQKLDSTKKFDFTAQLSQFPSLAALINDLELRNGIGEVSPKVGVKSDDKFKGDGKYERTDRMTARISGLVSDVKPNGMLLIEARESIQQDEETKTMVISGLCDPKDVTNANTVQSSQLANLTIKIEHGGQVKDSATKGLFPRIFETLFNF